MTAYLSYVIAVLSLSLFLEKEVMIEVCLIVFLLPTAAMFDTR